MHCTSADCDTLHSKTVWSFEKAAIFLPFSLPVSIDRRLNIFCVNRSIFRRVLFLLCDETTQICYYIIAHFIVFFLSLLHYRSGKNSFIAGNALNVLENRTPSKRCMKNHQTWPTVCIFKRSLSVFKRMQTNIIHAQSPLCMCSR